MSKRIRKSPTLLQTLLNRPSQSYSFPQVDRNEYYSSKNEMMKAALEADEDSLGGQASMEYRSTGLEAATPRAAKHSDVWHQNTIPGPETCPERHSRSSSLSEAIPTEEPELNLSSDESDSDNDVFYTPNTSPRTSFASTVTITMSSRPPVSPTWSSSKVDSLTATTRNKERRTSSISSTSVESTFLDGLSVFSSYASSSGSTGVTTPEPSVHSSSRSKGKEKGKSRDTVVNGMGQEWAKDVRWLVPPPSTVSSSSSTSKRKAANKAPTTPRISRPHKPSRSSDIHKIHHATMAAVLEEDEGVISHSQPSSRSGAKTISNAPSSKQGGRRMDTSSATTAKPHLMRRKSRSLEDLTALEVEDETSSGSSTPSRSYTVLASRIPSLPSYGTPGYTSLTLPRAPPPSSGFLESVKVGKVDLTRSGLAQTTMASVEVTRGLSTFASSRRFMWLSKDNHSGKGKGRAEGAFSFTSYRKPPTHVPEGHVLVQVWAVGIDGVDASICGISVGCEDTPTPEGRAASESGHGTRNDAKVKRSWSLRRNPSTPTRVSPSPTKSKQPEVGFVPGRSFVGRVMEVGDEDEVMRIIKKGEWVVGLLDVRKCGALQEFIVVDRHRLHSVPHPALPPSALVDQTSMTPSPRPTSPSSSVKSEHKPHDSRYPVYTPSSAPLHPDRFRSVLKTQLTFEELALLPTCGVQAYRAARTFSNTAGRGKAKGRILVLRGHDGAGAMATQMLVRRGWGVCVHASVQPGLSERQEEEEMRVIQARVRDWGADEVIFDDSVIGAIQQLVDEKEVFDGILDTVGGKEVWEVGKKLLGVEVDNVKQFTTLVGDFPTRPIPSASDHFKASLRSMKGGDGSGSSKVAYTWIGVDQDIDFEGEDVSVGIGRVLAECTGGSTLCPFVGGSGRVVTFERAPEIFRGSESLAGGSTLVVRVVL